MYVNHLVLQFETILLRLRTTGTTSVRRENTNANICWHGKWKKRTFQVLECSLKKNGEHFETV